LNRPHSSPARTEAQLGPPSDHYATDVLPLHLLSALNPSHNQIHPVQTITHEILNAERFPKISQMRVHLRITLNVKKFDPSTHRFYEDRSTVFKVLT
ncbi:hypothetical protein, partial [Frankia tisae]|uniref:hypothetical protein n=1 Tax=Frankia tisae TaxID=2950104 RepID=UPI0021C22719